MPGASVRTSERTGRVIRISQDNEKALVRFPRGATEWVEFYKLEMV